jgi:hypothetical protein
VLLSGSPLAKLGAFGFDNRMAFFEGGNLAAEIDSIEAQVNAGNRTFVSAVRPLVDGGTLSVRVGTRERTNDPVAWSTDVPQNAMGTCLVRSSARYHRARVKNGAEGNGVTPRVSISKRCRKARDDRFPTVSEGPTEPTLGHSRSHRSE